MKSLRGQLTRWLLCATTLLSVVAGVSLYVSMREALLEQFDSGLMAKAHAIGSTLRIERDGRYEMDFADESMKEYLPGKKPEYFQVIGPSGKTLEMSTSLQGKVLVDSAGVQPGRRGWDMTLPDGRSGRAMAYSVVPASEDEDRDHHSTTKAARANIEPVIVIVARGRGNVDEVLEELLTAMVVAAAVLAIVGIIAVRFAVAQGLKPVNVLAAQAANVGPETLDYRFDVNALPLELQPICRRLNDLLERLDQAFKRERRLNADIAHELRTPIAELRTLTEVAQKWPGGAEQSAGYFRDAHDIGLRMEALVETLLALARSQSRKTNVRVERIEIAPLMEQVTEALRATIGERRLEVTTCVREDFAVDTDRPMFRRIIENLMANAVQYTPAGGRIECAAATDGQLRGTITIGNSNDSLASADLTTMFEPFWRKDAARTGDSHSGLGLALVGEYARQLGISITPRLKAENWFEIAIEMPCVAAGAAVVSGTF